MNRGRNINAQGFSLVELLIATAVFLIVTAMAASLIRVANFNFGSSRSSAEVQEFARAAMKFLDTDITNSGQGYLQGEPTGTVVNGPLVSVNAFRSITGIDLAGPPASANSQALFSLVPIRGRDNLGNGTSAALGSSDRLTVAYADEFFTGGKEETIDPADPSKPLNTKELDLIRGRWQAATRTFTVDATTTVPDPNNPGRNLRISYSTENVRPGDIMLVSATGLQSPVLIMVTAVTANTLSFQVDPLNFNRFTNVPPQDPDNAGQPHPIDSYPIDRLNLLQPTAIVTVARVNLNSYLVDVETRDLLRRRYTFPASGLVGDAFIDDPVCQNVERLLITYNNVVPGAAPDFTPTFSADINEIDTGDSTADLVGTLLSNLHRIRRVNVTLTVRSTEVDRRNGRPARFTLQSSFAPRNVSYIRNEVAR